MTDDPIRPRRFAIVESLDAVRVSIEADTVEGLMELWAAYSAKRQIIREDGTTTLRTVADQPSVVGGGSGAG